MCRIASLELGNNVPGNLKIFSLGCVNITIERYFIRSFSLVIFCSVKILVQLVIVPIKNAEVTLDSVRKAMLHQSLEKIGFQFGRIKKRVSKNSVPQRPNRATICARRNPPVDEPFLIDVFIRQI